MAPEAAKFLWDAVEAAAAAQRFAQGKSLDDYLGDELLRSTIERQPAQGTAGAHLSHLRFASVPLN